MDIFTKSDFDINNVEVVQKLISENKINVNSRLNGSPLVSVSKNPAVIKLLIEHNVNLNMLDDNGKPPIFCHIDNMEIFDILIEAKADLSFKFKEGRSLLHEISNKIASSSEELSAEIAMMEKLISLGIPVDIQDQLGRTPLFGTMQPEKAWALIKNGADVNHHSREQRANSPLLYCADNKSYHISSSVFFRLVQLLLDNGADRDHCDLYGYCFAHLFWEHYIYISSDSKFFEFLSNKSLSAEILKLLRFPYWVPHYYYSFKFKDLKKLFERNPLCDNYLGGFSYRLSRMISRDKKSDGTGCLWCGIIGCFLAASLMFYFGFIMFTIALCFTFLICTYNSAIRAMMYVQLRNIILKHNPYAVPADTDIRDKKLTFAEKVLMKNFGFKEDQKDLID